MGSYDSDSSGAEDDDYTETNVLLGYASKEATDDSSSQLGGHPVCALELSRLRRLSDRLTQER